MKLNDFHKANIARQHEAFAPPHPLMALVACVQEEVGELEAFKARVARQLDEHFAKFSDVVAAINTGFAKTGNTKGPR
jgi:hypothetical protein